jgi:putative membrane protein
MNQSISSSTVKKTASRQFRNRAINLFLFSAALFVYIWSAISPRDYFVWFLETFPVLIGAALMYFTKKSFPLSNLLYRIIFLHMIVLSIGGHYTYAEVPLFNYFKEIFSLSRNNYDKVGHFLQGVTPALLIQEIIYQKTSLRNKILIALFSISSALAFSACYEIFEWIVAVTTASGQDFISMQGDVWDTQGDMLTALIGAVFAIFVLRRNDEKNFCEK